MDEFSERLDELYQHFHSDERADRTAMEWMEVAGRALNNAIAASKGEPVEPPRVRRRR
jgi:hypothetical protein